MARSESAWNGRPPIPPTHYVDPRIYADEDIFREEQQRLFRPAWLLACHESELPEVYDYRTYAHPAGVNLLIARGDDGKIRAFYNVCPHRGNTIVYAPANNGKYLTCIFHSWSFNSRGECVDIPRAQAYGERVCKADVGLREVRCEVAYGGFVWVNLDDNCGPLAEYIGPALNTMLANIEAEPLDVFTYHRATVNTNWKFWHETNSEFYHDFLHYHNRQTSMLQPGYWDRVYEAYPNGHVKVGEQKVNYAAYEGNRERTLAFPGMQGNEWKMIDLFPGMTYNLRGSSLRIDSVLPLSASKVIVEYRGLGLKRDTPDERAQRVRDYNSIWGPFGRNLHEDLLAVSGQGQALGRGQTYILHAREEERRIHDEIGLRHYYQEWSRRMGRLAYDPSRPYDPSQPYGEPSRPTPVPVSV